MTVAETAVRCEISSWYAHRWCRSHVTHASSARKDAYVRACVRVCVRDVSMPAAYLHGTRSSPAVTRRCIYSSSFLLSFAAAFNAESSTTRKRRMTTTTTTVTLRVPMRSRSRCRRIFPAGSSQTRILLRGRFRNGEVQPRKTLVKIDARVTPCRVISPWHLYCFRKNCNLCHFQNQLVTYKGCQD